MQASRGPDCILHLFVLIVVCNELAMRVDIIIIIFTTRQKAAQGTFVAWLWQ
jgi:NADH:ubiquinone oxidoreductase subunit K